MKKHCLYILLLCSLMASCRQSGSRQSNPDVLASDTIRYARGIQILRHGEYTVVEVKNPWEEGQLLQRYILVGRDKPLPGNLPAGTVVRVPLQKVAVYTAVHAGIVDLLGETGRITGVCEPNYMNTPAIREGLRTGRIRDIGEATAPNVERMIEIGTEYVIASPFQNSNYGAVEKTGIPIIEGADYMEAHPLGRTEWIRFYGLLFDREEVADSLFRATERRYLELKALAAHVSTRPTVVSEKRFGSTWYVPAGESYIAHFFADAGADYIFGNLPGTGSVPMSFETVLDRAIHADFWLIKYNQAENMTYGELRREYPPYENFDSFGKRNIFGCNTGHVPYYEESPIHPDYLLKDLIRVFHPELLPGYAPRYFMPLDL